MTTNTDTIRNLAQQDYKWGFVTEIEEERIPKGLNEDVIRLISAKKNEPEFMREWRLKAYRHWASLERADAALAKVGLAGQFDTLISAEMVSRGKPDPEVFLMALELHHMPADHALVFEDAESGLAAARAAGIEVVQIASDGKGGSSWAPFLSALDVGR